MDRYISLKRARRTSEIVGPHGTEPKEYTHATATKWPKPKRFLENVHTPNHQWLPFRLKSRARLYLIALPTWFSHQTTKETASLDEMRKCATRRTSALASQAVFIMGPFAQCGRMPSVLRSSLWRCLLRLSERLSNLDRIS